ncbi:HAD family hydrolase [Candidatus Harpocratesius sp.]
MEIQGYIFDIDGTLLDSNIAHLNAWRRALREYGIFKNDEEIISQFGLKTAQICRNLAGKNVDHSTIQHITEAKTEFLLSEIEKIAAFKGVNELLEEISKKYGKIVFVSNNFNRVIARMIEVNHWNDLSIGYIGIDEIKKAKPDPEMIKKALTLLNLSALRCVMIGDSQYDIIAGKAAGTRTIAVCSSHSVEYFSKLKPDLIISEVTDLMMQLPLNFL